MYGFTPYAAMGNSPMVHTDPKGDILPAILIGAGIGVLTNGLMNATSGEDFFKGAGSAALFGAIGGAVSFGIGTAANSLLGSGASLAKAGFQVAAHGYSGGMMSMIQGGNFGSGFLSGAISSGLSSGANALELGNAAMIGVGGLGGGIGSSIGGGNFWTGFGQGLLTSGLNHGAHDGWFGENIAAALWSGHTRHLFGPDAMSIEFALGMGLGPASDTGLGGLAVLRGVDAGKVTGIFDGGIGVASEFSADVSVTKLYHDAASIQGISIKDFLGARYTYSVGLGIGAAAGVKASYSRGNNHRILGLGIELGVGFAPVGGLGAALNYGATTAVTGKDIMDFLD